MKYKTFSKPSLIVKSIKRDPNKITVSFLPSRKIQSYFNKENTFVAEYTCNIEDVPISCAVIPFVVNILPIVWLTDATLYVDAIDKSFFESIESFKQGYMDMYPDISFKGEINTTHIIDNTYPASDEVGILFSGGVDAFSTLLMHYNENPMPITIIGADIKLDDIEGINNLKEQTSKSLYDLSLKKPCFIKTNFRSFINEGKLDALVKNSKDGWWHGFQHGIGIIGLSAPIAYTRRHAILYIASSYTKNDHVTCASHPSIDNNIRLGSTVTRHDQYENSRQDKIGIITEFHRRTSKVINLRVCWESRGAKNCCRCEKCLRTIYALYAEGEKPTNYGFDYTIPQLTHSSMNFRKNIPYLQDMQRVFWIDIQNRFKETQQYSDCQEINWIYNIDFSKRASKSMRLLLILKKIFWWTKSIFLHLLKRLSVET